MVLEAVDYGMEKRSQSLAVCIVHELSRFCLFAYLEAILNLNPNSLLVV